MSVAGAGPAQGDAASLPSGEDLDLCLPGGTGAHPWPSRAGIQVQRSCIDLSPDLTLALDELVHFIVGHGLCEFFADAVELR